MDSINKRNKFELVPPGPKLKSSVWKYFGFYKLADSDETHYDRTLCKLCNNLLAYNSGCTTNMRMHLIRSHEIQVESKVHSEVKHINIKQCPNESKEKPKKSRLEKVDEQLYEFLPAPPKLKALVWQHFGFCRLKGTTETILDWTYCTLCHARVAYTGCNTTSMRSHLGRYHDIHLEKLNTITSSAATDSPEPPPSNDVETIEMKNDEDFSEKFVFVSPKSSLKALVWDYFGFYKLKETDEEKFDRTCCKLCKTMIKYTGGSTTNMRAHLKRTHQIDPESLSPMTNNSDEFGLLDDEFCISQTAKRKKLNDSDERTVSVSKIHRPQTARQLKKVLKSQYCENTSCARQIQLDADGSPPQFCSGCGLLLSTSLSELWTACVDCCQLCGKIKDTSSSDIHFCSRCGGYLADEVEVFPHDESTLEIKDFSPCISPEDSERKEEINAGEGELLDTGASSSQSTAETTDIENQTDNESFSEDNQTPEGSVESTSGASSLAVRGSTNATNHECEFCNYKTSDLDQFTVHLKAHFNMNPVVALTDVESEDLFGTTEDQKGRLHDLIEHIKESKQCLPETDAIEEGTGGTNAPLECYSCSFECETKEELDAHLASHKIENVNTKITTKLIARYCRKCKETFTSLLQLKEHMKTAQCEEKVLACDECDFMTAKLESFRGHKRRNHGDIVLKKCDYCDRMFKRKQNLEEHMNTHTGSKPFQCDKCGKAFHTNSSWYKHKRSNCETGLRQRERKLCSHCGKEVINLSKHISDVHFHIKDFHCETCKKSFGTQYHLDRHLRIHTGVKPFPCKYCDYRASQKVVTDSHMRKCKFKPVDSQVADNV